MEELVCPRCGGKEFTEAICGPDSVEDDISYTSDVCVNCGLWHSGWTDRWLIDCVSCPAELAVRIYDTT